MTSAMKIFSASLLLVSFAFAAGKETSEMHTPAFANANHASGLEEIITTENGNIIDEEKSPLHDPAISVGKPSSAYHHPQEHSAYHTPAMANGQSSHVTHHQHPLYAPIHATIVPSKNPDNSSEIGAAIVTHKSPFIPGKLISGISTYSSSNSEHVPAVAVSGVSQNQHPVAVANPSKVPSHPHFSGYASFGGHPTYHETHMPALATPNTNRDRPGSIWDKATTHGTETTEKTVLKFPMIFSVIANYATPLWSKLTNSFPSHHRSLDRDLEASLPTFNATDYMNATNLMKFEEIVQTNRQKWEIPVDEDVMKSPEFKEFWVVYKQYLEKQLLLLQSHPELAQQSPQADAVLESLPKPASSNHLYDSYLNVYRYCIENKESSYPLYQEDAANCKHFFKCYRGNAYHFQCAKGTSFNSAVNMCLYSKEVDCGPRP